MYISCLYTITYDYFRLRIAPFWYSQLFISVQFSRSWL